MDQERAAYAEEVRLPSGGSLYEGNVPDGKVRVAPMTTKEEKMLATGGGTSSLTIIDNLIERCVDLGEIKPQDLCSGDRAFLMMNIRAATYGQDYEFQVRCPACQAKFRHTIQIPEDLDVVSLPEDFEEPIEVELPMSKSKLKLRVLRGYDERAIEKYQERIYSKINVAQSGDPSYAFRISRHIVSWTLDDGEEIENTDEKEQRRIIALYESLFGRDSAAIRSALSANDCGVNTNLELKCPKCRATSTIDMPMTTEFFRPGGDRGIRYI